MPTLCGGTPGDPHYVQAVGHCRVARGRESGFRDYATYVHVRQHKSYPGICLYLLKYAFRVLLITVFINVCCLFL